MTVGAVSEIEGRVSLSLDHVPNVVRLSSCFKMI